MSNQAKIKNLTIKLVDAEQRCKMWVDSGILLSKRIRELEQKKGKLETILHDAIGLLMNFEQHNEPDWICDREDLLKKYSEEMK